MNDGANDYYYVHDHLYSPVALVYAGTGAVIERYEYDAYGNPYILDAQYAPRTTSLYGNHYYFTGRRLDELDCGNLKVIHYRARYYDPWIGRFLSYDSSCYVDGMNLYEYVGSSPVNRNDPLGTKWCTLDFVSHYCFGKDPYDEGDPIDLGDPEIGLLEDFKNSPSVSLHTTTYEMDVIFEVAKSYNKLDCKRNDTIVISGSDTVITDVTFEPCLFAIGNSTFYRSFICALKLECCKDCILCWAYACTIKFAIKDRFEDPLDIGIEIPGCTPYPINASWTKTVLGGTCK